MADAKIVWADIAREELEKTARTYNAVIEYGELAEAVQARSGIRTKMLMHYWIGEVLGMVSRGCASRREPMLSALCVHQDGTVGEGFASVLVDVEWGKVPADLDLRAAEERLACYRYFGAELPPDGGVPTLTPKVAAKRSRAAKRRAAEEPRTICPTCHLALPATGRCDTCDDG